ncbi:unnamed protein product [Adineta ricciae]|uniref:Tetratricopeptide repeat protein 29 n=1 Tax=Adineta ricciae TaxID=249248 RepID=A0A814F1N1_ADIRI|nr:unnamed protein product [Adineta ricciae]
METPLDIKRTITHEEIAISKAVFTFNTDEDLTVIWYDDQLDDSIRLLLEHSCDHTQICYSLNELITVLDNIINEKIILIVAGRYSRQALSSVHIHDVIDSIYIFCFNRSYYEDLLEGNQYPKLLGIYTEYQALFTALEKQIHCLLKHLSIFNLFSRIDKPIRELEHESASYLWYQLLRDTLMTMETENDRCKQELIDVCRSYYRSNEKFLEQIKLFDQTYKASDAIYWYTKDCFLYRFVNKALRTEDIETLYRLRYFIKDLCKNLKSIFDDNLETFQIAMESITVYRGLTLPLSVIDQLRQSIGKYISTNGFLSTTFKRDVAEMFSANVIFEIKIDTDLNNIVYAYVSRMSINPSEDEVLIDLGAVFQIVDVQYINKKYTISMIGVSNDIDYLKNDYFQVEREYLQENLDDNVLSNINAHSFFGKFLSIIGSHKKAIAYYEELYKNCLACNKDPFLRDYEIYIITGNLADAYGGIQQYDFALKYAFESYETQKNFRHNYSTPIAASLLRLSLIYLAIEQVQLAYDFVEEAFRTLSDHCNVQLLGALHFCMSRCYFKQMKYSDALEHCQKALEKFGEARNSIANAEIYHLMGHIFLKQSNTDMGIDSYKKALVCQQNIYSRSHLLQIQTCHSLGKAYQLAGMHQLALNQYLEVLEHKKYDENDGELGRLHASIACCYFQLNSHDLALKHADLSLNINESSSNIEDIEISYVLMGEIYDEQRQFHLSMDYYAKLVSRAMECNNYEVMKTACSKYVSSMTYLINEEHAEQNMEVLSNFYRKYVFIDGRLSYNDFHRLIMSISLIYLKTKQFQLGVRQFRYMLKDIEIQSDISEKDKFILVIYTRIAWLYEKDKNYHLAIDQYQAILDSVSESNQKYSIDFAIQSYESIGNLYYELKEYTLAIEKQKEGLSFIRNLNSDQHEQDIFNLTYSIAKCYSELENDDFALTYYRECVEIQKHSSISAEESDDSVYMYEIVADSYCEDYQYDLAIDSYVKGLNILEQISPTETAQFHYKIGTCYKMKEENDLCIRHFEAALRVYEDNQSNDNFMQLMDIYFELGWFHQHENMYDLAIEYFQKMLNIQLDTGEKKCDIADSYVRIGKCYQEKLLPDLSLDYYEQALKIYLEIVQPNVGERRKTADLNWRIARLYQAKEVWGVAIDHYESSLKMLPFLNEKLIFDLFYRIGLCYNKMENYPSAIEYFQKAERQSAQQNMFNIRVVDLYAEMAFCFCNLEDWKSSVEYCTLALGFFMSMKISSHPSLYRLHITAAHAFGQQEKHHSAIEHFQQALEIQENHTAVDRKSEMIFLNNQLGYCYYMCAAYDTAYEYCHKSIEIAKNSSYSTTHSSMVDNYELFGNIYVHYNDKVLARNCFIKALNLLQTMKLVSPTGIKRIKKSLENLRSSST